MFPTIFGKGGIRATIIADSISQWGKRLTTFELEYPRFIHAEIMTHRLLSRNCASSRAIPSKKMFNLIEQSPAIPIHWGKNQTGMQAYKEHDQLINYEEIDYTPKELWHKAKSSAISYAYTMSEAGYHKQITNRLVEPFQMIKAVISATEYDNFYWLRNHHAAQPEIKEVAECMLNAYNISEPVLRARTNVSQIINDNKDELEKVEYHLHNPNTLALLMVACGL